ncbi:hypothetical protein [Paenibacillus sp. ACRRY]|uniref:hypothetical protein n=1 Tax=Paenibacillus sp. ACRRY TaxID=2918208 RepID=UPI001EF6EED5|nr:hypothetical protein [Paenibacillus sp. ACRRY]MCG7384373.1 hypothetical protein [Paenibacillus sp. ACRRY]
MNKKSIIIAIFIGLIIFILPIILYFAVEVSDESAPLEHSTYSPYTLELKKS